MTATFYYYILILTSTIVGVQLLRGILALTHEMICNEMRAEASRGPAAARLLGTSKAINGEGYSTRWRWALLSL